MKAPLTAAQEQAFPVCQRHPEMAKIVELGDANEVLEVGALRAREQIGAF